MQKYETEGPDKKIEKDLDAIFGNFGLREKKLRIKLKIKNDNLTKRKVKRLKFDKTD
jgi:hypothetical protein